jgi:ribonuclease HI
MKHVVTDLNDRDELVMFSRYILGNFCFKTVFGQLEDELYPLANSYKQYKLLHSNQIVKLKCTLVDCSNDASVDSSTCKEVDSSHYKLVNSSFTNHCTQLTNHNLGTLSFDTSNNTHGVDVGYLLVDTYGIQTYFSYYLESRYTNNDAKYEALIQGLTKEIDLNVKCIEVFGDTRVVIKQVRNSMFCTSYHLRNCQQEVWSLINKFESFNIKSIPHTKNYDIDMLMNEASNLELYDGSIDKKKKLLKFVGH